MLRWLCEGCSWRLSFDFLSFIHLGWPFSQGFCWAFRRDSCIADIQLVGSSSFSVMYSTAAASLAESRPRGSRRSAAMRSSMLCAPSASQTDTASDCFLNSAISPTSYASDAILNTSRSAASARRPIEPDANLCERCSLPNESPIFSPLTRRVGRSLKE